MKREQIIGAIGAGGDGFRAVCTWGDGPDVLVVVPPGLAFPVMAVPGGHSFGMHSEEARALAAALLAAATEADELQRGWVAAGTPPKEPRKIPFPERLNNAIVVVELALAALAAAAVTTRPEDPREVILDARGALNEIRTVSRDLSKLSRDGDRDGARSTGPAEVAEQPSAKAETPASTSSPSFASGLKLTRPRLVELRDILRGAGRAGHGGASRRRRVQNALAALGLIRTSDMGPKSSCELTDLGRAFLRKHCDACGGVVPDRPAIRSCPNRRGHSCRAILDPQGEPS